MNTFFRCEDCLQYENGENYDDDDDYCLVESHANEARDSGRSVGDDN